MGENSRNSIQSRSLQSPDPKNILVLQPVLLRSLTSVTQMRGGERMAPTEVKDYTCGTFLTPYEKTVQIGPSVQLSIASAGSRAMGLPLVSIKTS